VPDNWSGFLDFLIELPSRMTEDTGVQLVYTGYTADYMRYDLLTSILIEYQYYADHADTDASYNSELLKGILSKLEQVDFVALGCPEELDDSAFEYDEFSEDSVLMETGAGCCIGYMTGDATPVLMRMSPDAPAYVALDATVIVVNPYTKNPEVAQAFIDEVAANLSMPTLYAMCPDLNEAVRGQQNQDILEEAQAQLEEVRRLYEEAGPDEKQAMEMEVRDVEEYVAYIDAASWVVSPTELEWYRAHDDDVIITGYNWLYPDTDSDDEEGIAGQSGEAADLIDQYIEGQITADDLLAGIDRKIQMSRMEGM